MPEIPFDQEHKSTSIFDTDQLRLDANEKARILIMDQNAKMQWVHYILTGDEDRATGRRMGRYYVCLGDGTLLGSKDGPGVDVERCPACKIAEPGRDVFCGIPRCRFVVNIARYRTNLKGQIVKPISLALNAWVFAQEKYNMLADRAEEHGDLRRHDIIVTCTSKQYQKFDMDVAAQTAMQTDTAARGQYKELQAQRSPEIELLIAQPLSYDALERLLGDATPTITDDDFATESKQAISDIMDEIDSGSGSEGSGSIESAIDGVDPFAEEEPSGTTGVASGDASSTADSNDGDDFSKLLE